MKLMRIIGLGLVALFAGCDSSGQLYDSIRLGQVVELEAIYQGTRTVGRVPGVVCFAPRAYGMSRSSEGGYWDSASIEGFVTDEAGMIIAKLYVERYRETKGLIAELSEEDTQESLLLVFWPGEAYSSDTLRTTALGILSTFGANELDVGSTPLLREERFWGYLARDATAEQSRSTGSEMHGRQEEITVTGEILNDGVGPCVIDVHIRQWVDHSAMMGSDW